MKGDNALLQRELLVSIKKRRLSRRGALTFSSMKKKDVNPSFSFPGVACGTEYDEEKVKQYSTSLPVYPRQRVNIRITLILNKSDTRLPSSSGNTRRRGKSWVIYHCKSRATSLIMIAVSGSVAVGWMFRWRWFLHDRSFFSVFWKFSSRDP